MKLSEFKKIIREELANIYEAEISDQAILDKIDEFYKLQTEVDDMKSRLAQLMKDMKGTGIEENLRPIFESMKELDDRQAIAGEYIIKITRMGGKRPSIKYKEAWELAYSKLNGATKNILDEALKASTDMVDVKYSFNVEPAIKEGIWDTIKTKLRSIVNSFMSTFNKEIKQVDKGIEALKALSKKES